MRHILFLLIIFIFSGCTNLLFEKRAQTIHFNDTDNNIMKIKLTDHIFRHRFDNCVTDGYTIKENNQKYGKLYIEHIELDGSCKWTGFSRGLFTDMLKRELNLGSIKLIERKEFGNYEFSKYKFNDRCVIYFIFIWQGNSSTFIIDQRGNLYNELKVRLGGKNDTSLREDIKCDFELDVSLVEDNIIDHHFGKEDDSGVYWQININYPIK